MDKDPDPANPSRSDLDLGKIADPDLGKIFRIRNGNSVSLCRFFSKISSKVILKDLNDVFFR